MSEDLLKAIVQLFAIVAKERITDDERQNIKEFLSLHLNHESIRYYLTLFDDFCHSTQRVANPASLAMDEATHEFVDDWSHIIKIARQVNQALTTQQKAVLFIKIAELVFADGTLSERQSNLIFYIGEALKLSKTDLRAMRLFVTGQTATALAGKNILLIDESTEESGPTGRHLTARNLEGLLAILRLEETETYFIKYIGTGSIYLNSVTLRPRKVDVFPTGSIVRGARIEPIYYSDIVGQFLQEGQVAGVTFQAEHLFYHFSSGKAALQNINLAEQGGRLIGIMGASGSGKSTLLHVLNGSEKPSSGRVLINGINIHQQASKVEGLIGFVPQDDLLLEDLSVYENLYYSARLCLGGRTESQVVERVQQVLEALGLTEIAHLKVGSSLDKTISGGQRKRLNIGLELLREPSVLFVDEPTSGLSSRDSENIMDLLKELSLRGKMVFVVIHQPSSDIFKMFDTLLILDVGGFQIYYGNPTESVTYFQQIINAANKTPGACPECGNINPEQIFNIIETRVVNEFGRFTAVRKISPGQWYTYFKQKMKLPKLSGVERPLPRQQRIPPARQQWVTFIQRDVRAKMANRQYMLVNALLTPLLAFFIAFFVKYYDVVDSDTATYTFYHNFNVPVFFFMSVVVALFVGLIVSAEEIFRDRKIMKRERYLHLSRTSYLTSKVTVLFVLSALQTLSFYVVGNLIIEIPLTEIRYWVVLFSCSCFANLLGLNISSAFNSAVTIYILIPILIIPQLLLSGVVISFDRVNPFVGTPKGIPVLGEAMASRWAYEAMMVSQFKDNAFEKPFYALDQLEAMSEYKRMYYLPELESELALVMSQRNRWRDTQENNPVRKSLALLQAEIRHELQFVGADRLPEVDRLEVGQFDSATYSRTAAFLRTLKEYYGIRMQRANRQRDSLQRALTATPEGRAAIEQLRLRYANESVTTLVENTNSPTRIVKWRGQLVQKIYPIYFDEHRPAGPLDFRTIFFSPGKPFLGGIVDTLYFNVGMIWAMTLLLYAALHTELLKRAIQWAEQRRRYGWGVAKKKG